MSENLSVPLLASINTAAMAIHSIVARLGSQLHAALSPITGAIQTSTQALSNEIRNHGLLLSKLLGTGIKGGVAQSAIGKEMGETTVPGLFSKFEKIFAPLGDTFKSLLTSLPKINMAPLGGIVAKDTAESIQPQTQAAPSQNMAGKLFKGLGSSLKGIGKMITSSFSPIMLLFQIISPMINAFLEPLELMSPLFESWGSILSQLLVPIIMALMDALMPLTPVFVALVNMLMPIIMIVAGLLQLLAPFIELLASGLTGGLNFIGMFTNFAGGITVGLSVITDAVSVITSWFINIQTKLSDFFAYIGGWFDGLWTRIREKIAGFGNRVTAVWKEVIDGIFTKIKDKFKVFSGGGLDQDPNTWW